jgi:hypothetical protein
MRKVTQVLVKSAVIKQMHFNEWTTEIENIGIF